MTNGAFEELVQQGIETLPRWVHEELVNVLFLVENVPSETQRIENKLATDETLFGLYEGVPLSERGNESPPVPDVITIFKQPILEAYTNEEDVRACVENTIWHEVAHYFGHDEGWVEHEEIRRGKIK